MNHRRAEFDALLAEYRRDLPQRLARIEALLAGGRFAELGRDLHTLAGSAGTYGLRRVGEAAAAAEAYIEGDAPLDAARRAELERLVTRVRDEARDAIGS
jgi:HPt (histidine-containing phosphotransfer) domain-containing protein